MTHQPDVQGYFKILAVWVERALAGIVVIGVLAFGVKTVLAAFNWDWSSTQTFYELIYRVLLAVIAVVVARKMLKPDVSPLEIVASVGAFVGLLAARRYLLLGAGSEGATRDAGRAA